jgi:small subunit ribosomal protein S6e
LKLTRSLTISQNEYAQVLAKRVAEAKATKADLRKRRASSMRK